MRDNQKSKVYKAGWDFEQILKRSFDFPSLNICGSNVIITPAKNFGDIDSIQRYVNSVLSLNWVKSQWGESSINVRKRKGETKAHYFEFMREIAIPDAKWALNEFVVLHEMAHHFNGLAHGDPTHGANFVGIHLKLIEELMSVENAFVFTYLLNESGVDYAPIN